jgi:hypothetical protein
VEAQCLPGFVSRLGEQRQRHTEVTSGFGVRVASCLPPAQHPRHAGSTGDVPGSFGRFKRGAYQRHSVSPMALPVHEVGQAPQDPPRAGFAAGNGLPRNGVLLRQPFQR